MTENNGPKLDAGRMEMLSGFQSEEAAPPSSASSAPSGMDEEDTTSSAPPRPTLPKNQVANGLVALFGVGAVVFGAGSVLQGVFSGLDTNPKPTEVPKEVALVPQTAATGSEVDSNKLLEKVALLDQKQQYAQLGKNPRAAQASTALKASTPAAASTTPRVAKKTSSVSSSANPPLQASATKAEDPQTRWQALAQIGSYGSAGAPVAVASVPAAQSLVEPKAVEVSNKSQETPVSDRDEAPILTGRAARSLSVGSTADGVVLSPVIYEQAVGSNVRQTDNNPDAGDVFLVRLEQPLKASDGSEALPVGTQMAVKVGSVSSNGFMRLSVASIAVDGQDTPIDPGTISVRGAAGYPLIAHSAVDRGAALTSQDGSQALWSGVSKTAGLFNRVQSQVVTSGLGGFSSSTTNPPPDVAAGFLEGAAGALAQNSQQRSQRATQETLDRPNIWTVDPGTKVQIVVNKAVGQL
jgi:Bacterial conjugation TrbI-like protein